jgi:ABC-type uncharacterized transport system substrate-binding protein
MTDANKRIVFSLLLIVLASAILLWSDRHNRHTQSNTETSVAATIIPLAILQHSSNPLMDDVRSGIIDALNAKGYTDGRNLAITTYNPEGDLPTANLMAQKITSGDYRLAISISTVMLQALANANRTGRVAHVFGAVSAPVDSGVGIKALDSLDKPTYLTGIGTPQPVAEIFRMAKQVNPALKTVGVVWNPAEVNSEICTKQARAISAELGLVLLEAPVEQAKDIREAAQSLVARGAEAIWTGGDATVISAVDSLFEVARATRIPVFSNISGHVKKGSLFDLGADYHEVGEQVGRLVADILSGTAPAVISVKNYMPKRLLLNEKTREALLTSWIFSKEMYSQAVSVIGENGIEIKAIDHAVGRNIALNDDVGALATSDSIVANPRQVSQPLAHKWKIKRISYVESSPTEDSQQGIDDGFKAAGMQVGRDFALTDVSAQGDMTVLSSLADAVGSDGTELVMTLSTPTLQTTMHKVKKIPVLFTLVSNAVIAGAGADENNHLANVTGVSVPAPIEEMVMMIKRYFPEIHRVGSLFTPGEDNSVYNMDLFEKVALEHGLSVSKLPVNSSSELPNAALAMASQPIDAWVQIVDNQMVSGFVAIAQAATRAKKPLFTFSKSGVEQGAAVAYSTDYYQAGFDTALKAVDVMHGKSPNDIPFSPTSKINLIVSEEHAKALHMTLPVELIGKADLRLSNYQ